MTYVSAFRDIVVEPQPQRIVKAHPAQNSIYHGIAQALSLLIVTFDYIYTSLILLSKSGLGRIRIRKVKSMNV